VIAVDTSALIAILADEPEARSFRSVLTSTEAVIGAPTYLEFAIVAVVMSPVITSADLSRFLGHLNVTLVDFTIADVRIAEAAIRKYGKGRHKAALNFSDCCSYATAKARSCPLLFKGHDFSLTDLTRAE
jgi:ribonuclease VapC